MQAIRDKHYERLKMFVMSAGHGGDDMASGLLQDQPHHSQRTEVLHPTHVGPASDPHHSSGHSGNFSWMRNDFEKRLLTRMESP